MNGHNKEKGEPAIKIRLPESPELMIQLAEKLIKAHILKGAASPITNALAIQIKVKLSLAKEKHEEGLKNFENASVALESRDMHLGMRTDGNVAAEVSLKFYLQCAGEMIAKDQDTEVLREFGFSILSSDN
jgi:hypothetical protein